MAIEFPGSFYFYIIFSSARAGDRLACLAFYVASGIQTHCPQAYTAGTFLAKPSSQPPTSPFLIPTFYKSGTHSYFLASWCRMEVTTITHGLLRAVKWSTVRDAHCCTCCSTMEEPRLVGILCEFLPPLFKVPVGRTEMLSRAVWCP